MSHWCCRWCYTALRHGPWEKLTTTGSIHFTRNHSAVSWEWNGMTRSPMPQFKEDIRANGSIFPYRRSTPLTFWSHLPTMHGYTCFTSTTSIHWYIYRHASCHWLEPPSGPSTQNLASTGGGRYGSTHQCPSIHNPGPLVVQIATTLSRSSAAVSEWVSVRPRLSVTLLLTGLLEALLLTAT